MTNNTLTSQEWPFIMAMATLYFILVISIIIAVQICLIASVITSNNRPIRPRVHIERTV